MRKSKQFKKKRHAVVFGGSGGIGRAVTEELGNRRFEAITVSYNKHLSAGEEVVRLLKRRGFKNVFLDRVNPSDEGDVKRFLDAAVKATGVEVTSAVYAIGISPNKPFRKQRLETTDEGMDNRGWRDVYETNVFGCMVAMRAVAERMRKNKIAGSLVFITSTNGINSHSQISAHYDSSKAAQSHLMRIMAEVYAKDGIRINGVAPGWVNTEMNKTLPISEVKKETRKIWSGRFAHPHEIAAPIVDLLEERWGYTYGQDIMIDGGYR